MNKSRDALFGHNRVCCCGVLSSQPSKSCIALVESQILFAFAAMFMLWWQNLTFFDVVLRRETEKIKKRIFWIFN